MTKSYNNVPKKYYICKANNMKNYIKKEKVMTTNALKQEYDGI